MGKNYDCNTVIINSIYDDDLGYNTYSFYKKSGDKYIHVFDFNEPNDGIIRTTSGEAFINAKGRLFSISKKDYINTVRFEKAYSSETSSEDFALANSYLCSIKQHQMIYSLIKNNNLIFLSVPINVSYKGVEKNAVTFCFINEKGKLVSKVYFRTEDKFYSVNVSEKKYDEALESCKERLLKEIKKEIETERKIVDKKYKAYLEMQSKMDIEVEKCFDAEGLSRARKPKKGEK